MWRAEGKWLPKTSRKSVSQSVFCGTSTYCVLNTVPPIEDDHGNSNSSHVKIFLPKKLLECLPKCSSLPKERHRWNTNEEIAAYLITFEKHEEWLTTSPKTRPQNGSMILYNRKKVKYRKDGYCWKKRKDGKTTREDHMKLKVQGVEASEVRGYRWLGPSSVEARGSAAPKAVICHPSHRSTAAALPGRMSSSLAPGAAAPSGLSVVRTP
ncbi:calmodulin-binding transcription activator 1 isoform X8 [Talpa occidentalis]|uniref:calmodulin-binding transcription activator 1 isoform X8 n=1 Tax=Talpa occidentalis TaxID=50954 RepID=UPI0023F84C28|nr:calmodulin-binding transcription activator 1 isoform X8 [Talpa occidentalis]